MISDQQEQLRADILVKKFCAYGFLKNLRFFEPFLFLYLLSKNISMVEIGFLISIRELSIQLFEIPSGLIADHFGRKKELCSCFIFYIISFISFAFCFNFWGAATAMFFFGLGEAFRSGTHKAFIYTYLDVNNLRSEKTFLYGLTRSYSLIGTALSSLIGIAILLWVEQPSALFLFAVIPYLLDLLLIASYPSYLDSRDCKKNQSLNFFCRDLFHHLKGNFMLWRLLLEEGIYEASLSFSKDIIQPLLQVIILSSGFVLIASCSPSQNLNILLGLVYVLFNLAAALSSRKAYWLRQRFSCRNTLWLIHLITGLIFGFIAIVSHAYLPVCALYLILYLLLNLRKPIWIDEIEEHIAKNLRTSVLSISSQLKSLSLAILAPTLTWIAQHHDFRSMMLAIGLLFLMTLPLLRTPRQAK
ncbi:MAG: MFS transporter [Akkermansia sp.]